MVIRLLERSFKEWKADGCPRMAAAMSYYTIFSLPPLLLIVLTITGVFVEPSEVEGRIEREMSSVLGAQGARQVQSMIRSVNRPDSGGPHVVVLGILGLLVGATGAFAQLQEALNRAWEVKPDPDKGGIRNMLMKRVLSLGMVLTIVFLLLVSLLISAVLSAFGDWIAAFLPGVLSRAFLRVADLAVSVGVISLLFALIFKILPDAEVAWSSVWVGGLGTAILFVAGKFLLGVYFARSDPGEAFGAAGSLALIMVWVYYSSMILFFGAEFTQAWATERGDGIQPEEGAVRVVEEERYIRGAAGRRR